MKKNQPIIFFIVMLLFLYTETASSAESYTRSLNMTGNRIQTSSSVESYNSNSNSLEGKIRTYTGSVINDSSSVVTPVYTPVYPTYDTTPNYTYSPYIYNRYITTYNVLPYRRYYPPPPPPPNPNPHPSPIPEYNYNQRGAFSFNYSNSGFNYGNSGNTYKPVPLSPSPIYNK